MQHAAAQRDGVDPAGCPRAQAEIDVLAAVHIALVETGQLVPEGAGDEHARARDSLHPGHRREEARGGQRHLADMLRLASVVEKNPRVIDGPGAGVALHIAHEAGARAEGAMGREHRLKPPAGEYEIVVEQGEKLTSRDGSTLSSVLRQAWDGDTLQIINKNSPAKATAPHISLIGHITEPELRRYLTATEQANGFGNRFLWVLVKRSKLLPEGGSLTSEQLADLVVTHLFFAADFARNVAEMRRDEGARQLWKEVYPVLSAEHPGLLGAVTARAEAQVMRLACLYALLDQSAIIQVEHLWAALAVWHYCEQSARHVFSDALGDPVADDLLRALRRRPHGMTRTAISELFGKNRSAAEIGRALAVLLERGLVRFETEESDGKPGRPPERWYAVEKTPEGNQA